MITLQKLETQLVKMTIEQCDVMIERVPSKWHPLISRMRSDLIRVPSAAHVKGVCHDLAILAKRYKV